MYEAVVKGGFSAAHSLRNYRGKCEKVHGHNWTVEVAVASSRLDEAGLAIDFVELKKLTNEVIGEFDHTNINEIPPFNRISPSSENMARWIYEKIKERLSSFKDVKLWKVTVFESEDSSASYYEGKRDL